MPKVEIDYSNTIIYKIVCNDPAIKEVYVGHTTNFVQRKHAHKQTCNNIKSPCYNLKLYKTIRANGNWSNWEMTIINFYNCKDQFEARQKEQEHFVILKATLNSVEPLPKKVQQENKSMSLPIIVTEKSNNCISCVSCNYTTLSKKDFNKHLSTGKHQKKDKSTSDNILQQNKDKTFDCHCGKKYKERSGLWRHKKLCVNPDPLKIDTNLVIELLKQNKEKEQNDKEMMMTILKENSELKTMILDMCKTMTATASSGTTNNNNTINNNTTNNFNLNVFLNETCKDALNLTDFVSSLVVKLKDLEETAKFGYTEGVSRIFINGLNELEVNMRPIHCSDLKRETLYVKNDDKWTKEDADKPNITKAIKKVSNKNIQQVFEWQKKYPDYKDPESKQNDKYQEMLFTAMGGSTDEDQSNNIDKIIRNITKEVVINKNI
jgi:hypothetical protein